MDKIQLSELMDRIDQDEELLKDLMEIFLEEALRLVPAMKKAVEEKDATALREAAHEFKGMCLNVSTVKLHEFAKELQDRGESGDLENAEGVIQAVEEEFCQTQEEINRWLQRFAGAAS